MSNKPKKSKDTHHHSIRCLKRPDGGYFPWTEELAQAHEDWTEFELDPDNPPPPTKRKTKPPVRHNEKKQIKFKPQPPGPDDQGGADLTLQLILGFADEFKENIRIHLEEYRETKEKQELCAISQDARGVREIIYTYYYELITSYGLAKLRGDFPEKTGKIEKILAELNNSSVEEIRECIRNENRSRSSPNLLRWKHTREVISLPISHIDTLKHNAIKMLTHLEEIFATPQHDEHPVPKSVSETSQNNVEVQKQQLVEGDREWLTGAEAAQRIIKIFPHLELTEENLMSRISRACTSDKLKHKGKGKNKRLIDELSLHKWASTLDTHPQHDNFHIGDPD